MQGIDKGRSCVQPAALESQQLDALGHRYTEWEIIAVATMDAEGEQRRLCINCGDTQFEKITKTEKLLVFQATSAMMGG